jgi:hypothetical protein
MAASITRIRTGAMAIAMALVLILAGGSAAQAASFIQPAVHPAQLNPDTVIPWGTPGPDPLRSDTPTTPCKNGPDGTPGARDMLRFLEYWWPRGESEGIYACRGIGDTGSPSLHSEGRALDYHLNSAVPADKAAAVAIRKWFLADDSAGGHWAMARRFGIQELIYNEHIWTAARASKGWRDYAVPSGGDKHLTHLHVGLNRPAANRNTSAWTGYNACRPGQGGCPPV